MNDDIMHKKISGAIGHDAKTDCLHPPGIIECAEIDEQDTWNRKNDKERIILFEKTRLNLVMIFMQIPEKSMHNITMRKPCDAFHDDERSNKNQYVIKPCHILNLRLAPAESFEKAKYLSI